MSREPESERTRLRAAALRAVRAHQEYADQMANRVRPRAVISAEELDREGMLAGNQALVDMVHASVRDLYDAGDSAEDIARFLGFVDSNGDPLAWEVHQMTHTDWCHFCGVAESVADRLSLGSNSICDRCVAFASEALRDERALAGNSFVSFERSDERASCLFCKRPGRTIAGAPYASIGRDRWWKVPICIMVKVTRPSGESAAACDSCVEFHEEHFSRPVGEVKRMYLF